jgi:hypothetical protein
MAVEIEKKKDKKNPHLALTSIEHQNGSANKRFFVDEIGC